MLGTREVKSESNCRFHTLNSKWNIVLIYNLTKDRVVKATFERVTPVIVHLNAYYCPTGTHIALSQGAVLVTVPKMDYPLFLRV